MASFKDLFVNGVARFIGKVYAAGGVVGNLEGTATKATQDGSGNIITSTYMTKSNPTGTGSFSMNRKANTTVGTNSVAEGNNTTASGNYSHAEGLETVASGVYAHAEGYKTKATSNAAHAEGGSTIASSVYSHAEGNNTTASGMFSHAEGATTIASNAIAHAEGNATTASGTGSHAEGCGTVAAGSYMHVAGMYNATTTGHARVTGWGTSASAKKDIETLDTSGNLKVAGKVYQDLKANGNAVLVGTPSVGCVMEFGDDYDPNTIYPGTTWELYF